MGYATTHEDGGFTMEETEKITGVLPSDRVSFALSEGDPTVTIEV